MDDWPIRLSWVGVLLGLVVFGPIGAVIGWFVGRALDKRRRQRRLKAEAEGMRQEIVAAAVVVLAAKLSKADGRVSEAEIRAFKQTFNVPPDEGAQVARLWDKARQSPYGYETHAWELAQAYKTQPAMLEKIFMALRTIAAADGDGVSHNERMFLEDVARIFGLRDMAMAPSRGPWGGYQVDQPAHAADVEFALHDLIRTDSAKASDRTLDRLEAASARTSVTLGKWKARLESNPRIRSVVGVIVATIAALVSYFYFFADLRWTYPLSGLLWGLAVGAASGGIVYLLSPRPRALKDEVAEAARKANLDPDQVAGAITDAEARVAAIRRASAALDQALRRKVDAICDIAARIIDGLRRDPTDLSRSRRFLGHYLVATEDLVKRYADLAGRGADSERLALVFAKFEPVLSDIEELFRKQHDRNLEDDALKLDVEIDVLRKTIKSEAL